MIFIKFFQYGSNNYFAHEFRAVMNPVLLAIGFNNIQFSVVEQDCFFVETQHIGIFLMFHGCYHQKNNGAKIELLFEIQHLFHKKNVKKL